MSIPFVCPSCKRRVLAPDEAAGRRARCPCGHALRVPAASPSAEDLAGILLPGISDRTPFPRRKRADTTFGGSKTAT